MYQPVHCCEEPTFREMYLSLNKKSVILSCDKLQNISEQYAIAKRSITDILKRKHFSFTTDGWTSLANVGYVICTAHFIDSTTWKLHSLVLGSYEKDGTSRAEDVVIYCESQLMLFDLSYSKAVAVVTDTEATMISAGCLCFWLKTLPHVGSSTLWYSMYLLPDVLLFKHVALPYWYGYLLSVLSSIPLLGFSKLKEILLETPSGHSHVQNNCLIP
jgi:hypothetical protein